jgi:cobalt-zinc-cadmium efflux system outer membrane protein
MGRRLRAWSTAAFAGRVASAGAVALTGCAVHHYHHFEPTPERAALIAPPVALPTLAPPAVATAAPLPPPSAPPDQIMWRRGNPGSVAPVSFQQLPELPPPRPVGPIPLNLPPLDRPADEAGVRLTLDQIINAVLVVDPRLRAGFEAISQANADALAASLRPNPTLLLDIQLLPLTRPFTPDMTGGPPQQDVNLTYPIDWYVFGKRAANMAAAALGVRVSEADFADRVRQRVTDAVSAYYDVLEAWALLDLARLDADNLRRVEGALAKGVEAGGRPQTELNRIRLDRLRAEQGVRDAETALITAKAKLRSMIGRSDADPAFDVAGSLDAPLTAVLPEGEEAFRIAVANRPDIQSARMKEAQARANVVVEHRKAYPDLAPMFGYTRQYQMKAIGQPDASSWTATVTMSLPVFNRNQGGRAKAASQVAQYQFEYRAALADLRAEVETADRQLRAARANAEAIAAEQLKLAREVLESVTAAYQAGGRPLLDLLDAQRNFRDTYRTYISSRAAYWRAVYRYGAALGQKVTP